MRVERTIAFSCAILLGLAGSPLVAAGQEQRPGVVQAGQYARGVLGTVTPPASQTLAPDAVYGVGPWPTYVPPLAEGPGRDVVQGACSICHNTTYITMQPPLPAKTWQAEVTKMVKTFGAPISEETARTVVAYLTAHYTPETRRQ